MSLGLVRRAPGRTAIARRLVGVDVWLAATLLAIAAAAVLRLVTPTNEDVSWLIELAGRTLSGARPYVDFLEVNPPGAIWLYLAPTALARLLHLRPEAMTDLFVFLGTAASLTLSGRILRRAGLLPAAVVRPLLFASVLILLVLPSYTFAERDDIAVLAALPGIAAFAVRRHGVRLDKLEMVLAGLGNGIVVVIKPMFVLGFVGPCAALLLTVGWRTLATAWELWFGAAVAAAYGLVVTLCFPSFVDQVLPMAVMVYVPRRLPWPQLLWSIPRILWPFGFVLLAVLARITQVGPLAVMLASAAAGYEVAFLQQGKGFAYHLFPATSLALLALASGLLAGRFHMPAGDVAAGRRFPFGLAAAFFAVCCHAAFVNFSARFDPDLFAPGLGPAIQALGPRPRVLTISPVFALGQPFVRDLGGVWAGSAPATWISNDVDLLEAAGTSNAAFPSFVAREQALYAGDIARTRPDAVLVGGARWQAWIDASPALTRAMTGYRRSGPDFNTVALWVRDDLALKGALP